MSIDVTKPKARQAHQRWYGRLYVQVGVAIVAGVLLGHAAPETATSLKPLGDGFVALVKMIITPVIFLTVVSGIASVRELSTVGRVAGKAFAYFFVFSTLALLIGATVANVVQPGVGLHIDPRTLDAAAVADYAHKAHETTLTGFLMAIVPTTALSALTDGSILQALFVAVLFGVSLSLVGEPAEPVLNLINRLSLVVFRMVALLMAVAPIGAFAAIAFTVGRFGIASLYNLGELLLAVYATSLGFVLVVLGLVARLAGFSILRLLVYLKAELLLVFGTSSSEAALPGLIAKMEAVGCDRSVVGLVVPTGYSFNLDGTNIYMTMAALFIAQACDIHLGWEEQAALLGVAMLSSKGAAGVTGAGFITLAATLSIVPSMPVAGMALILGVDRLMSQCRSLTNFVGNAVATIVVARWEGRLDQDRMREMLLWN
jgi:aerobic C4-dicarboxylate transport protein